MKHLTPDQLFMLIDSSENTPETDDYKKHIDICHICREEYSLYEITTKEVKEFPLQKTSFYFTENLVSKIYADKKKSTINRFISQKGYYLLGILFFLIFLNSLFNTQPQPALSSENLTQWDRFSNVFLNSITDIFTKIGSPVREFALSLLNSFGYSFLYGAITIIILFLLDKLFFKKIIKLN